MRASFASNDRPRIQRRSATPSGEQGRPGARCTRDLACKGRKKDAHEHTGSAEAVRPSLRDGFTAYSALSLATGFLSPSSLRSLLLKNLTPASGRQDHAISPSTSRAVRQKRIGVHRIPPHVRDDRETPLVWDGMGKDKPVIWLRCEAKCFSRDDWTGQINLKWRKNFGCARTVTCVRVISGIRRIFRFWREADI